MGTLIKGQYTDHSALRFNGIDNYVWRNNPTYKTDMVGAIDLRFRAPVLTGGNSSVMLAALSVEDAGSDATLAFLVRSHSLYAIAGNYLDVLYRTTNGATPDSKSGTTSLVANTWYSVTITSDGKIYLNGVEQSYQTWAPSFGIWTGGWFGNISGVNRNIAIGALRRAGVAWFYAGVDVNNIRILSSVPTVGEVTELYNSGDPRLLSPTLKAKVSYAYDMEKRLYPLMGTVTETLTPVNIVSGDYITP